MGRPIRTLLIANRGEIAVRVARTAREMGIRTIAVHSDLDADALHVRVCDAAVPLGAPMAYLDVARVVEAARAAGADAVHPGYGFLSENAAFAEAVLAAGLVWVGPPPAAMRAMGDKVSARAAMRAAGVPVVPGVESEDEAEIAALGFPLLVKAAGGGGGRGMRIVEGRAALGEALAEARAEAGRAFGDARVYAERLVRRPRHVEVQVLADAHGTTLALGERECSIQRRHQKLVEETPSPAVTPAIRAALFEAAVRGARAVGYVGAGTMEFLLDEDGAFWFLEMNTRLQVEHPVTELVTGLDLVREQLRVAMGEPLGYAGVEVRGHAIECRVIAEDPSRGFAPSPGTLARWRPPAGPGIRVDAGVEEGTAVPDAYDPLLAKVIAFGHDREAARVRMVRALSETVALGVDTNVELLRDAIASTAFAAGETRTDFLERLAWAPPEVDAAAFAAAWRARGAASGGRAVATGGAGAAASGEVSPFLTLGRLR